MEVQYILHKDILNIILYVLSMVKIGPRGSAAAVGAQCAGAFVSGLEAGCRCARAYRHHQAYRLLTYVLNLYPLSLLCACGGGQ